ncbi:hypothetical protein KKC32_03640 [Patescibacteria group bacterium]|nr:hypothetical protein [Patescibacteria group bacterium]
MNLTERLELVELFCARNPDHGQYVLNAFNKVDPANRYRGDFENPDEYLDCANTFLQQLQEMKRQNRNIDRESSGRKKELLQMLVHVTLLLERAKCGIVSPDKKLQLEEILYCIIDDKIV